MDRSTLAEWTITADRRNIPLKPSDPVSRTRMCGQHQMFDDSDLSPTQEETARFSPRRGRPPAPVGIEVPVHRFERRCESIATLLRRQMEAAASFHDLSRRRLRTSHRSVLKLTSGGAVPTPQEFWEQTAQPQARNLFDAVTTAIDAETAELTKALQQFATGVRLELRASGGRLEEGWTIEDLQAVADAGVRRVAVTVRGLDEIDELGHWWQARLRRAAMKATATKLLMAPLREFELVVAAAEMRLLEQPPWSHDDRLLSAFELTHSDIRDYAMTVESRMQRQARAMLEAVANEELIDGLPSNIGSAPRLDSASGSASGKEGVQSSSADGTVQPVESPQIGHRPQVPSSGFSQTIELQ